MGSGVQGFRFVWVLFFLGVEEGGLGGFGVRVLGFMFLGF